MLGENIELYLFLPHFDFLEMTLISLLISCYI